MTPRDLAIVRLAIAACKTEVESSIGSGTIESADDGSPWGRAFLKLTKQLRDPSTLSSLGKLKT